MSMPNPDEPVRPRPVRERPLVERVVAPRRDAQAPATRDRRPRRLEDLRARHHRGPRAARRHAADRARRLRGDHGQLRERQEHADEHPRLPGPADQRPLPDRRRRHPRHGRGRPRGPAQPQDRVRLPELQPGRPHERARERRTTAGLRRRRPSRPPPSRPAGARRGRDGEAASPPAVRALGRPAAARRGRACARHQPDDDPRRRAHRQPRLALDRGGPADLRRPQRRRPHGRDDHARARRGRAGQARDHARRRTRAGRSPHRGRARPRRRSCTSRSPPTDLYGEAPR